MPQQLAATFDPSRPGLPRGRTGLPAAAVRDAQRERLLRAVMATVAEKGYAAVTVGDIVAAARVSRKAFYAQFADKHACFLAAAAAGGEVLVQRLLGVIDDAAGDRSPSPVSRREPESVLRGAIRAYLRLCSEEPAFARCLLVELLAAGPEALALRNAGYAQLEDLFRAWHDVARRADPDRWPAVTDATYAAAVGAVHELVFRAVSIGATASLGELEEPIMAILLALFGLSGRVGRSRRRRGAGHD
jgi:AcrR family transcriptional regulator